MKLENGAKISERDERSPSEIRAKGTAIGGGLASDEPLKPKPKLRTDTIAVRDDEHANEQFRIDR